MNYSRNWSRFTAQKPKSFMISIFTRFSARGAQIQVHNSIDCNQSSDPVIPFPISYNLTYEEK